MEEEKYYFDKKEAEKVVGFIEKLNLDKGKKGEKIKLLEFQKKILTDLLCWRNKEDNTRKHREGFVYLPRKNGKSFLIACIFVYSLFCDEEYGAEYIVSANSRDQASLLFDTVKNMIEQNPTLRKHCRIIDSRKRIYRKATNSNFRVLSSDASKADSYNGYIVCLDETHEAKNDELYTKLKTSMGTRKSPLMLTITTASNGQDEFNLEYRTYLYAKKVREGKVDDPTFYSAIYEADDDCDLTDESQWYKSNPALGIFREYNELKSLAYRAKEIPAEEAKFRRLYLNQHIVLSTEQGINMNKWKECGKKPFDMNMLKGKECYAGLDLASSKDFAAFVMVFHVDGEYFIVPHLFKPSADLLEAQNRDGFDYTSHSKAGHMHATQGDNISYRYIRQKIKELSKEYVIKDIAFDRFGSSGIIADLQDDGMYVVDFGQGFRTMSPAIEKFYDVLFEGKLRHPNNPVLNWMAGNAMVSENPAGDLKWDKKKSTKKIDGIVAMTMALSMAIDNNYKLDLNKFSSSEALDKLGW